MGTLKEEQRQVRELVTEAITMLCKNGLKFRSELCIEGLIGITLDKEDIFLVNIKQIIRGGYVPHIPTSLDTPNFRSTPKPRKRRRKSSEDKLKDHPSEKLLAQSSNGAPTVCSASGDARLNPNPDSDPQTIPIEINPVHSNDGAPELCTATSDARLKESPDPDPNKQPIEINPLNVSDESNHSNSAHVKHEDVEENDETYLDSETSDLVNTFSNHNETIPRLQVGSIVFPYPEPVKHNDGAVAVSKAGTAAPYPLEPHWVISPESANESPTPSATLRPADPPNSLPSPMAMQDLVCCLLKLPTYTTKRGKEQQRQLDCRECSTRGKKGEGRKRSSYYCARCRVGVCRGCFEHHWRRRFKFDMIG